MFKYRASADRTPREDYLTEGFAGVLEASAELRCGFFQFATGQEAANVAVSTQADAAEAGRLDLLLRGVDETEPAHIAVLEHKIDAALGEDQLPRYEKWLLDQPAATRTLVYVAPVGRPSGHVAADPNAVAFVETTWARVFEWLARSVAGRCGRAAVLSRELLAMVDEWGLTMTLSAHDLTVAAAYWTTVNKKLEHLLADVRQATGVGVERRRLREPLRHQSAYINDEEDLWYYYGFDFGRATEEWDVARLGLPSAFFAICGVDEGCGRFQWSLLPDGWIEPPDEWRWTSGIRVKELSGLPAGGESLDGEYLRFLMTALEELRELMGLD